MISCNGIVGISLLVVALRRHVAVFNAEGTGSALATVCTLAVLTLVLPTFTTSHPGPEFSATQLTFAALASVALYCLFILVQTVRHRDYFLPVAPEGAPPPAPDAHAAIPSNRATVVSLALLVVALVAVVGLAKVTSPTIEDATDAAGFPPSAVGVVIALLVLLPETIAAARAAFRDRIQTSFNLAYGSSIASIGLTIPVIAVASIWLDGSLVLGLDSAQIVLLALTAVVSVLTSYRGVRRCSSRASTSRCSRRSSCLPRTPDAQPAASCGVSVVPRNPSGASISRSSRTVGAMSSRRASWRPVAAIPGPATM